MNTLPIAQPFVLQAEQAIIGALLADPLDVSPQVSHLVGAHFYDPFCRAAFLEAQRQITSGTIPDLVTLTEGIRGDVFMPDEDIERRIRAIFEAFPGASNIESWCELVEAKKTERDLASIGERLVALAHSDADVTAKVAEASAALTAVVSLGASTAATGPNAEEVVALAMRDIEAIQAGEMRGIATGIKQLDHQSGGLKGGELTIIAARPSVGKTTVATKIIASSLEAGHACLLFSLEMSMQQVMMRMLAARAHIHMNKIFNGVHMTDDDKASLAYAAQEVSGTRLTVDSSTTTNVEAMAAIARRLRNATGLDLIVIDYMGLVSSLGKSENRNVEVSKICRALKLLAMELRIPIVALSQLNRNSERRVDKRPTLSDLRDSGSIEQDADVVLFLHRENQPDNDNDKDNDKPDVGELIIGKLRNGKRDTIYIEFDGAHNNITETERRPSRKAKAEPENANPFFGDVPWCSREQER